MGFVSYRPFDVLQGNPILLHPSKTEIYDKSRDIQNATAFM